MLKPRTSHGNWRLWSVHTGLQVSLSWLWVFSGWERVWCSPSSSVLIVFPPHGFRFRIPQYFGNYRGWFTLVANFKHYVTFLIQHRLEPSNSNFTIYIPIFTFFSHHSQLCKLSLPTHFVRKLVSSEIKIQ